MCLSVPDRKMEHSQQQQMVFCECASGCYSLCRGHSGKIATNSTNDWNEPICSVNERCFKSEDVPSWFYCLRSFFCFFFDKAQKQLSKMIKCCFSTASSALKLTSSQCLADPSLHSRLNPWHSATVCIDRENIVGCSCTNIETTVVVIWTNAQERLLKRGRRQGRRQFIHLYQTWKYCGISRWAGQNLDHSHSLLCDDRNLLCLFSASTAQHNAEVHEMLFLNYIWGNVLFSHYFNVRSLHHNHPGCSTI